MILCKEMEKQVAVFYFMVRTCSQCQNALLNMLPLLGLCPRKSWGFFGTHRCVFGGKEWIGLPLNSPDNCLSIGLLIKIYDLRVLDFSTAAHPMETA